MEEEVVARNIVFSYPEWQVSLGLEMKGVHYSNNFFMQASTFAVECTGRRAVLAV